VSTSTGITDPKTQEQENLLRHWSSHYQTSADGSTTRTLFDDKEKVDTYIFNQWLFAYCNTFYAIDDFVAYNILNANLVVHLGTSAARGTWVYLHNKSMALPRNYPQLVTL